MSKESQIRAWLAKYLGGEISLEEFHDWFISSTWDDADTDTDRLVHRIQLRLAEYLGGAWTEGELRDQLWDLHGLPSVTICVSSSDSETTNYSSAATALVETQAQLSDREHAGEYA